MQSLRLAHGDRGREGALRPLELEGSMRSNMRSNVAAPETSNRRKIAG